MTLDNIVETTVKVFKYGYLFGVVKSKYFTTTSFLISGLDILSRLQHIFCRSGNAAIRIQYWGHQCTRIGKSGCNGLQCRVNLYQELNLKFGEN